MAASGGPQGSPQGSPQGIGFWGIARRTLRASARWGTVFGGNVVRHSSNWVQPVFDIDRPRYDDIGGSQFGITGGTVGAINEFPAVEFVNRRDWELHELNAFFTVSAHGILPQGWNDKVVHMMTPEIVPGGYNPIAFNVTGPFGPQFVTTYLLEQGDMLSFAGTNPLLSPGGLGLEMSRVQGRDQTVVGASTPLTGSEQTMEYQPSGGPPNNVFGYGTQLAGRKFSPPIRVPAFRRVAIQVTGALADFDEYPTQLEVSLLYNELEAFS